MSVAMPPIGVTVPTGNPDMLRQASRSLVAAAETLQSVADGFQSAIEVCDPGTWLGIAGAAYRIRVGETREAVRIGAASLRNAAAALTRLADQLQSAQVRAQRALDTAESAAGLVALANTALLSFARQGSDPNERIKLQRDLDYAESDLELARSVGVGAYQDAMDAARLAAAALNQATDEAKAPPPPPDGDMEPTETPWQFARRQLSDVFVDPLNPFAPGLSPYKEGRISLDWFAGLIFGAVEFINHGYSVNAQMYAPGYWAKSHTLVSGYERTLPSGRKVKILPYHRRDGVYVPSRVLDDTEKQLVSRQRARMARYGGIGLGFLFAGLDRAVEDAPRRDLSVGERASRIAISGLAVGGSSMGGSWVGGKLGALAGPGGAVVGGAIGGMVGGGVGGKLEGGMFDWAGVD